MTGLEAVLGVWLAVALRITVGLALGSLVVAGLLRMFPKIPAEARHGLWALVLVQGLLWFRIPVWLPAEAQPADVSVAESDTALVSPPIRPVEMPFGARPLETWADGPAESTVEPLPAESDVTAAKAASSPARSRAGIWPKLATVWKRALAAAWLAGAIGLVVVSVLRCWRFHRSVLSHSILAPEPFQQAARRLAERHGLRRRPRVLWCESAQVPMLLGLMRPTIVFPSSLIALPDHQWEPLLAHEVAHLCRRDRLFAAVSLASCMLNYFNPFAWWARGRMSAAREESADRWVTQTAGYSPKHYSRGLLAVAEALSWPQPACLGAGRKPSDLWHRVKALKELDADESRGKLWPVRILSLWLGLAILVSLISVRQRSSALAEDQALERNSNARPAVTDDTRSNPDEPAQPRRTLHFPADRAMGVLFVRDAGRYEDSRKGWQELAVATGDVSVPADKEVRLVLSDAACRDLSPLRRLRPNDLRNLAFEDGPILDDEALANITHLTGLKDVALGVCPSVSGVGMKHLARLSSLERLSVPYIPIGEDGLSHLASLKSLKQLHFFHTDVTEKGLSHLAQITSLKSLGFLRCDVDDAGVAHLRDMTSLESLTLAVSQVTDAGIAHLGGLSNLESLNLWQTPVGDAGLAHLRRMHKLRTLNLSGTKVTDVGLVHLAGLTNLESLTLRGTSVGDAGLVHVAKMQKLRELDLYGTKATDAGLAHLTVLASLERLSLPKGVVSDRALEHLGQIPSLRMLGLPGGPMPITDRGLAHLSKLKRLERLSIHCSDDNSNKPGVTDQGMAHVAKISSLKGLGLTGCRVTDDGLAALTELKLLKEIRLCNNQITWEGLGHLKEFPALEQVDISGIKGRPVSLLHLGRLKGMWSLRVGFSPNSCSDEVLADIAGLTGLGRLVVDGIVITDDGMRHLGGLTSLYGLYLPRTSIVTDDGLAYLAKMRQLNGLGVFGPLTDQGLEHLAKLETLRVLLIDLGSRTITDAAVEKLKQQIPTLEVHDLGTSSVKALKVGVPAPDFQVNTLDGKAFRLQDQRGKAAIVCFFATWSAPSVEDTPELKKLHKELAEKHGQFQMISLSMDKSDQEARRHAVNHRLSWLQAWIGVASPIGGDYGVQGLPSYFVIDREGKVAFTARDPRGIKDAVAKALKTD